MQQIHIKTNCMTSENHLIEVKDLKVEFSMRQGHVTAVNGISFQLEKGKVLGVVGESGSGKSVTARTLLRIEAPGKITTGEIIFSSTKQGEVAIHKMNTTGEQIRSIRWKEIAMIFQEPMTSFGPMHTFGNQIAEVLTLHQKINKNDAHQMAIESLRSVGMPRPEKVVNQYPHQISGGQRQRAMIAMALICNPQVLIADEPTTALDVSTEAQILEVLAERQKTLNTSILYISHNLGVVANIADEVIVMYLGKIVEHASVSDLFNSPKHPYTVALLNSIPRIDKEYKGQKLEVLVGNIPDPYNHPSGCKFHPRCPKVMKGICDVTEPIQQTIAENWEVACHLFTPLIKTNQ
jgi:peptide/nickel transport system ATP-binding protein